MDVDCILVTLPVYIKDGQGKGIVPRLKPLQCQLRTVCITQRQWFSVSLTPFVEYNAAVISRRASVKDCNINRKLYCDVIPSVGNRWLIGSYDKILLFNLNVRENVIESTYCINNCSVDCHKQRIALAML